MIESDELLAVRAAELYYDETKTQDEIGALLGITRWKVGRLLAQARELGYIRIEIVHPRARRLPLERALRERFGLADAVVVPSPSDSADLHERVARAAADYLGAMRPVPRTLGVSWGRTLRDIADHLSDGWATGLSVVQINGGVSLNQRVGTAAATAARIAEKGRGDVTLLPSPAIFERLETKLSIESDRTVAEVLRTAAAADTYLYGAGVAGPDSALVHSGYLTAADVDVLVARGAVGDVVGRYIDAEGMIVDPTLDERTVGLGLEALRRAGRSIAVIAGAQKHAVARAVVSSGLCTVLVTDEATATALLADHEPSSAKQHTPEQDLLGRNAP
ncbi:MULTISPECIES: sugar-binding transcriptional regulator [Plantibacter]|uniref:Deoxyribonucleoside regulator n=1 Tax=Plantibacter cousiniae (nom. nud.) TaxID=199709 RepID=A0ABY1LQA4_9MICO|nr:MULTISPECIES: sugar-binding transcriptional regulator [Plantibacter]MBD8103361.1 sugar-binding transcriptional regulator [Plantibacter sp. CFBP 8775]MDD9154401.1 sugar-binding transcriptional regulator [Plantibacter flavus]SKC73172.1 deoxyribonucleoside regulator [Plantibacter cousiniae]